MFSTCPSEGISSCYSISSLSPQRVPSAHLGFLQSWKLCLWKMWLLYAPNHHPVYATGCQHPSCAFEKANQILCTDLCPQGLPVCVCSPGFAGSAPHSSDPSTQKQCCSPALTFPQLMLYYHKTFICPGWCLNLSMYKGNKVLEDMRHNTLEDIFLTPRGVFMMCRHFLERVAEKAPEHCRDMQGCWIGGREVERVMKDHEYCGWYSIFMFPVSISGTVLVWYSWDHVPPWRGDLQQ